MGSTTARLAIPEVTLPLVEYFHSLQGEGYNAGRSAVFIRWAGCNLNCVFADGARCDTPWEHAREKVYFPQLLDWIYDNAPLDDRLLSHDQPMIVLTGGEPTRAKAFDAVAEYLSQVGYYVAVETNGTTFRKGLMKCDWITVSPKVSIGQAAPHQSPEVDQRVWNIANEVRYVITGPDDPEPPAHWNRNVRHYLSPALMADGSGTEAHLGLTPDFVPGAVDRCIELIQDNPMWRLSLQTHKWIRQR